MELSIRPMSFEERKYTYSQSTQLESQTGSIGRLRGDFGGSGTEFWTTWEDSRQDLKTDEFKAELDDVINSLRSSEYGLLKDRRSMAKYARAEPDRVGQKILCKRNYPTVKKKWLKRELREAKHEALTGLVTLFRERDAVCTA